MSIAAIEWHFGKLSHIPITCGHGFCGVESIVRYSAIVCGDTDPYLHQLETPMDNHKTISTLNNLIEISYDGHKGFANAAAHAKRTDLKALFAEYAAACEKGARELTAQVHTLGGTPKDSGTVSGALRRGLTELRVSTSSHTDQAILEECEKGEDVAKKAYADALKEDLLPEIRAIVARQNEEVIAHHDRVRDLRDMRTATA